MELREHYRTSVMNALGGYQLLEQQLKTYLAMYHDAVRVLTKGQLHYGYGESDFQNWPLGRLRSTFAKTNGNDQLAKDIQSLISHRDHIAHQAMTALYDQSIPDQKITAMVEENFTTIRKIQEIQRALANEMEQVITVFKRAASGSGA